MQMAHGTLHNAHYKKMLNANMAYRPIHNVQCTMHTLPTVNTAHCKDYTLPQGESQPAVRPTGEGREERHF